MLSLEAIIYSGPNGKEPFWRMIECGDSLLRVNSRSTVNPIALRNCRWDPRERGVHSCFACLPTHTSTWPQDKHIGCLNSTLSRLFFGVCPLYFCFKEVKKSHSVRFRVLNCVKTAFWLAVWVHSSVSDCVFLLLLHKQLFFILKKSQHNAFRYQPTQCQLADLIPVIAGC